MGRIFSFCLIAGLALLPSSLSQTANTWLSPAALPRPIVTSELGFSNNFNVTENTITAFSQGLARGASSFEFTSRITSDGYIVLLHNDIYADLVVEHTTLAVLQKIQPEALELQDALDFIIANDVPAANIMMQNNPIEPGYDYANTIADVVVKRILDSGLADRFLITAFDIGTIAAAKKHCGDYCGMAFGWLVMKAAPARAMEPEDFVKELRLHKLDALVPEASLVIRDDYSLLSTFSSEDMPVYVWWTGVGTNSRENVDDMKAMVHEGVSGFITPRVGMAVFVKKSVEV
jgi:glycerophosphoryl diester phosphodiesterase